MAGRKSSYMYFAQADRNHQNGFESDLDEFDESDVWGMDLKSTTDPIRSNNIPTSRSIDCRNDQLKKGGRAAAASLPLNIPDWSKILKDEYVGINSYDKNWMDDDDDEEDLVTGGGVVIPPHEYLVRNRAASFSVEEGIGRTLKGRDLSRVRNAIFEKTGFLD